MRPKALPGLNEDYLYPFYNPVFPPVAQLRVGKDFRLSGAAVRRAITRNTVLVVASSPGFPHGVIDNIRDIAAVRMIPSMDLQGLPLR